MRLADMNAAEKQRIIDRVEARRAFLASPEVRGWTLGIACGLVLAFLFVRIFA